MEFNPALFPSKIIPRRALRSAGPAPAERAWEPLELNNVLLCIDPSIANCGWAIIRNTYPDPTRLDSGVFHPIERPDLDRYDHLSNLIQQRVDLSGASAITPTHAIIEVPGGGQWSASTTQLMRYARAIGVCEATCHRMGLVTYRATVPEWKGMGKKSRTALIVKHCFEYDPRDDNEADALGLGLWLCSKTRRPREGDGQ